MNEFENQTVTLNDDGMEEYLSLKAAYMKVFSSEDGKRVLEDLRNQSFYDDPHSRDVNEMNRNEGARILFLRIKDLALNPMPKVLDN